MDRPTVRIETADAEISGALIYDGDCPFCLAAASALRRVPEIGAVAWDDSAAQAFLSAQFEAAPFALILVDADEGRVSLGRDAARELCDRAGLPVLLQDIVGDNYEGIADAIRTVSGLDRDPDPYHDTVPIAPPAKGQLDTLLDAAEGSSVVVRE